jgi:hypothetical protein
VSWCAVSTTGASGPYALYRSTSATCDATKLRIGENLTTSVSGFSAFFATATTIPYGELQTVDVDFPVQVPSSGNGVGQAYRLSQRVALRNTVWPKTAAAACSTTVPCTIGPCTVAGGCPNAWN